MKNRVLTVLLVGLCLLAVAGTAAAGGSFRLENGQLLRTGISRAEVISLVGQPLSKDVESYGVNTGNVPAGQTVETWTYILEGAIGGKFLVTLTLEGGTVTKITSKQQ